MEANNETFFDLAPESFLKDLAVVKGISNHEDLESIRSSIDSYLCDQNVELLEIGSGQGRVIDWILNNYYQKPMHAVDQSSVSTEIMKFKYKENEKVSLDCINIVNFDLFNRFNLALWLWAGFLELDYQEKNVALKNINRSLKKDGVLLIEVPRLIRGHEQLDNYKDNKLGKIAVVTDFGKLNVHLESDDSIYSLLRMNYFEIVDKVEYVTSTHIPRVIFKAKKVR